MMMMMMMMYAWIIGMEEEDCNQASKKKGTRTAKSSKARNGFGLH